MSVGLLVQLLYLSGLSSGTVDLGSREKKKYGFAIVCGVNNEWSPVP